MFDNENYDLKKEIAACKESIARCIMQKDILELSKKEAMKLIGNKETCSDSLEMHAKSMLEEIEVDLQYCSNMKEINLYKLKKYNEIINEGE